MRNIKTVRNKILPLFEGKNSSLSNDLKSAFGHAITYKFYDMTSEIFQRALMFAESLPYPCGFTPRSIIARDGEILFEWRGDNYWIHVSFYHRKPDYDINDGASAVLRMTDQSKSWHYKFNPQNIPPALIKDIENCQQKEKDKNV